MFITCSHSHPPNSSLARLSIIMGTDWGGLFNNNILKDLEKALKSCLGEDNIDIDDDEAAPKHSEAAKYVQWGNNLRKIPYTKENTQQYLLKHKSNDTSSSVSIASSRSDSSTHEISDNQKRRFLNMINEMFKAELYTPGVTAVRTAYNIRDRQEILKYYSKTIEISLIEPTMSVAANVVEDIMKNNTRNSKDDVYVHIHEMLMRCYSLYQERSRTRTLDRGSDNEYIKIMHLFTPFFLENFRKKLMVYSSDQRRVTASFKQLQHGLIKKLPTARNPSINPPSAARAQSADGRILRPSSPLRVDDSINPTTNSSNSTLRTIVHQPQQHIPPSTSSQRSPSILRRRQGGAGAQPVQRSSSRKIQWNDPINQINP